MLNRVILMGRLTADPELKQTPSGASVTSFSVAVERNFTGKDGNRQTDFLNVVAWKQTADFICKYFTKGRMIAIDGSLQSRSYEDRTGAKRTVFEVVADHAYFADSKQSNSGAPSNFPTPTKFGPSDFEDIPDNDYPF